MIETHKTNDGLIDALIEWQTVNNDGNLNANGEYLHVYYLWVHPSLQKEKMISYFINKLNNDERLKTVKYIYWFRKDRLTKSFHRRNVIRRKMW